MFVKSYAIQEDERRGVDVFRLVEGDDTYADIAPGWGNNCFAFQVFGELILEPVS